MVRARRRCRSVLGSVVDVRDGSWSWRAGGDSSSTVVGLCFVLKGVARLRSAVVEEGAVIVLARSEVELAWDEPAAVACLWVEEEDLADMGVDPFSLPSRIGGSVLADGVRDFIVGFATASGEQGSLPSYLTERVLIDMAFGVIIASEGRSSVTERRVPDLVRAQALLSARSADPEFTVATCAEELGMSVRHLQRLLRQTGTTPSEHLRRLRATAARELLEGRSEARVTRAEAAALSGFSSIRAMRRGLHDEG